MHDEKRAISVNHWLVRLLLPFAIGLTAALGVGCRDLSEEAGGESLTRSATDLKAARLKSINITPTPSTLYANATEPLTAIGTYSDGSTQNLTSTATWTSSKTNVATVSPSGLVTTISNGAAAISAAVGNVSGHATVHVSVTLMSIAVSPGETTLPAHTTQALRATGAYSNQGNKNLTGIVTWTSTNPSIATISSTGLLVAAAPGTATIVAATGASSSSPVVGTATITVSSATLASLAVTPASKSIPKGLSQPFKATATFSDGSTHVLVPPVVAWSSSSPTIAAISSVGLASAIALGGPVTISATPIGSTSVGMAKVTVTAGELISLAVGPATSSISAGVTEQLAAIGTYSDGTTMDITGAVTWTSSSASVATISASGLATGIAAGTATITATDPKTKKAKTAALTVTPALLQTIVLTPGVPSVPAGLTHQLEAVGVWSDGSMTDITSTVTWSSSAITVATVSQGLVSALTQGKSTISVLDPSTHVTQSEVLTVTPGALKSIAIAPSNPSIPIGATTPLVATATYTDNSTSDITQAATWVSANGLAVAVANAPGAAGQVTALAAGSALVTATDPATGIGGQTTVTAILTNPCNPPAGPTPAGTSCSDANVCNGIEVCDGLGGCLAGFPLPADDENPCTADACDPTNGVTHTPLAGGTTCTDVSSCATGTCDSLANCVTGSPAILDDGDPCTNDACDISTGSVTHQAIGAVEACPPAAQVCAKDLSTPLVQDQFYSCLTTAQADLQQTAGDEQAASAIIAAFESCASSAFECNSTMATMGTKLSSSSGVVGPKAALAAAAASPSYCVNQPAARNCGGGCGGAGAASGFTLGASVYKMNPAGIIASAAAGLTNAYFCLNRCLAQNTAQEGDPCKGSSGTCCGGSCSQAPSSFQCCNHAMVDTSSDDGNCGSCGALCDFVGCDDLMSITTEVCLGGSCEITMIGCPHGCDLNATSCSP